MKKRIYIVTVYSIEKSFALVEIEAETADKADEIAINETDIPEDDWTHLDSYRKVDRVEMKD